MFVNIYLNGHCLNTFFELIVLGSVGSVFNSCCIKSYCIDISNEFILLKIIQNVV